MIFRKISYTIALQFTGFVFALLLITGAIFLASDVADRGHQTTMHLSQILEPLLHQPGELTAPPSSLPPFQRDHIRIVDAQGNSLASGTLYDGITFVPGNGITHVMVGDDAYDILTTPVTQNGQIVGYIQVGDRSPPDDIGFEALLYVLISAGISVLTFGVGLFFARRSLRPAQDMVERLEQFTQDASHELRTPITAVSTSLDLAIATNEYPENVREAKKGLKEVSVLMDRLLELARLDAFSLEKEDVDLSALVTETVEMHRRLAAEKNVTITAQITPDMHVQGDPTLLKQVLNNLLTNAVKFNKPEGRIDVELTTRALNVRDTGKGIAASALPHIFDRFYQEDTSRAHNKKEGLGLGLALSKRIVELHGWSIMAESVQGEGTTFSIHLSPAKRNAKL